VSPVVATAEKVGVDGTFGSANRRTSADHGPSPPLFVARTRYQ
jgi:hypothetical protein